MLLFSKYCVPQMSFRQGTEISQLVVLFYLKGKVTGRREIKKNCERRTVREEL